MFLNRLKQSRKLCRRKSCQRKPQRPNRLLKRSQRKRHRSAEGVDISARFLRSQGSLPAKSKVFCIVIRLSGSNTWQPFLLEGTTMKPELEKYRIETPLLWQGMPVRGLDGYGVMQLVEEFY